MFNLILRLILVVTFVIDIFYFHKLFYFFKVIWISIFIFIPQYIIFCFKDLSESIIIFLEKNVDRISTDYIYGVLPPEQDYWNNAYISDEDEDEEPPHKMHLTVQKFLEFRYSCILFNKNVVDDFSVENTKEYFYRFIKENAISEDTPLGDKRWEPFFQILENKVNTVISIYKILINFHRIQQINSKNENMKAALILILWFYFLSWFYILIVSIHTLSIWEVLEMLNILSYHIENVNPFIIP